MADWESNWRGNGVIAAVLFIVAYIIYGGLPKVGAPADKLVSFYDGDSTRVLIATVVFGFAILCLMWFAAALTSVLRDADKAGWGTAASSAAAAVGAVYLVIVLLGTTTWAADGFWAADRGYALIVPTIVMLLWIAGVSAFLMRSYSAERAPDRAPLPA